MAQAPYVLTIRDGPRVTRSKYESIEQAVAALRARVEQIRTEGDLPPVKMLREFQPGQQVKARLEISTGKVFRRREVGVDLMGDGAVVPYRGGIFKSHLDPPDGVSYDDAVAEALRE
jgi:hypothetical protein